MGAFQVRPHLIARKQYARRYAKSTCGSGMFLSGKAHFPNRNSKGPTFPIWYQFIGSLTIANRLGTFPDNDPLAVQSNGNRCFRAGSRIEGHNYMSHTLFRLRLRRAGSPLLHFSPPKADVRDLP